MSIPGVNSTSSSVVTESATCNWLPARWTSVANVHPVVAIGQGTALFRLDDLLQLARLLTNFTVETC